MRLFVAITFDEATRDHLETCRDRLISRSSASSPVPRDNMHLTLAFLGEIDEDDVFAIEDALDDIANPLENTLAFDRAGTFKTPRRSRKSSSEHRQAASCEQTWWMGIQPNEQLDKLQHAVQATLEKLGFTFEQRAFTPHITLARRVVTAHDNTELARFVAGEPFCAHINSFSLMESKTQDGQVVYEEICAWE